MLFILAAVLGVFAIAMWVVFLRPATIVMATGAISNKTFKPAGEYFQYPNGARRDNFYGPNKIPIAECYILIIHMDELGADVGYAANIPEAESYDVGQRVTVRYQVRGIPGIWRRVFVLGLAH